ncbi:MAG: PH domain-containing protein, partial [Planctomycetes bacterium]|nr:PH domain-containing protein [Planctomycetota bacterium]
MEPESDGARRLHPATLLFDVGRRFASLALWSVTVVLFAASSEERWVLLFLLPPLIEALIRYASFRYAFGADQLVIRSGLFVRGVRHVPYARIQNIDTAQGPLHRLLGVVEVRLETAAGKEPEAVFRVITSAQLAELRARVFGPVAEARTADEAFEREAPFFRMSVGAVLLFGLLSQRGLVLLIGALAALRELPFWERLEQRFDPQAERLSDGLGSLGAGAWVALALLAILVLQLGSMLWALLTLHGFRIERRGEDLRTTCGLLTRQTASLHARARSLLAVRESLVQRWIGRASVRALSAGGDSTQASQIARKWLVPLCRRAQLPAILREVQPEAPLEAVAWRPVHPRARRRLFVKWAFVLELLALLGWLQSTWLGLVAALAGFVLAFACARLRARQLGWALGERAVFLRDGLFGRRLCCVRFEKIQSIQLVRTPLDRRARMARLTLDTAGAAGSELRFELPFL